MASNRGVQTENRVAFADRDATLRDTCMTPGESEKLWCGLRSDARDQLIQRDYNQRVPGALDYANGEIEVSIPGVEIFPRAVHQQRHRGIFSELAREGRGILEKVGFNPQQWSTARMWAGTAKGFHIHPPHVPDGEKPEAWFQKLYVDGIEDTKLRPHDREQWDIMFFIQGSIEMILIDERAGMPREKMHFFIDGDSADGPHKAGVVIPAGVAHALRAASSEDPIMVYGTSTVFVAENEGRIASSVESFPLPAEWEGYAN
ncbi:MAG: hypothetical protein AAGA58_19600 [Verrucomicrobiota bacterium]